MTGELLKLEGGLADEHFGAEDGFAVFAFGLFDEFGFEGVVDGVEDDGVRVPFWGGVFGDGGGVEAGGHAEGVQLMYGVAGGIGEGIPKGQR